MAAQHLHLDALREELIDGFRLGIGLTERRAENGTSREYLHMYRNLDCRLHLSAQYELIMHN